MMPLGINEIHIADFFHLIFLPSLGIFFQRKFMAKNTSVLLGDHFDDFIQRQISTGQFSSASEVIRAALRILEYEQEKKSALIEALKKGEQSGFIKEFDRNSFLSEIKDRYGAG